MHVMVVPSWYPAAANGLHGSFFAEQVAALRDAGHHVSVLAPRLDPMPRSFGDLAHWARPSWGFGGDGVMRVRGPFIPRSLSASLRLLRRPSQAAARELVERDGFPELIHAHSLMPGAVVGADLARRWGVPFVVTEHRPSSLERYACSALLNRVVSTACVMSTVSDPFSRELERVWNLPSGSVRTLPNLLDRSFLEEPAERASYSTPPTFARVLHVSHLDPVKCVDDIILATDKAQKVSRMRLQLVIVGGSPERVNQLVHEHGAVIVAPAELGRKALRREGAPSLLVTGRAERDQVRTAMDESDVFVLASRVESFGVVLIEAFARGLRLVSSDTWGGRFVVPRLGGTLVPIGNQDALAGAIVEATASLPIDRAHQHSLAAAEFSASRFVERTEKLWTTAMDSVSADGVRREIPASPISRPRVLVVTTWFPSAENPRAGSFVEADVEVLKHFADVRVLHLDPSGKSMRRGETGRGAAVMAFPLRWRSPLNLVQAVRTIRAYCRDADVVHSMALPAALLTRCAVPRLRNRVTWMHTEHFSEVERAVRVVGGGQRLRMRTMLRRAAIRTLTRFGLSRPDVVAAVSAPLARSISAITARADVTVVGNVVQPAESLKRERLATDGPDARLRVIGVGGMVEGKNPVLVVETLAEVMRRHPGRLVELTWAGDGPLRPTVISRAQDLGVPFKPLGNITKEEVYGALSEADLFFVPTRGETFFLGAAEAAAHGLPVLAGDRGPHTRFLDPRASAFVDPEEGPVQWADALEELMVRAGTLDPETVSAPLTQFAPAQQVERWRELYRKTATAVLPFRYARRYRNSIA